MTQFAFVGLGVTGHPMAGHPKAVGHAKLLPRRWG